MADKMPYKAGPKAAALIKAGLMVEGGPQPVAKEEPRKQQEKVQAP